jgi:ribosomal protein L29
VPVVALAQSASISTAKLDVNEDGYQLNADIELQLTAGMQEAVRKGVPLYFIAEFQLTRSRWYWLDKSVISVTRDRRISYAPLTDQYRIAVSGISQNVSSFEEVRRALSRIRSWTVAEKGQLRPGERYEAALRFQLDTSQLPKPFQLNVITSKEWSLSSEWYRWSITP